ncbi:TOMM precursor leader peptide-binding protein [Paracoccus lichenicola]|nr:TOMM precursor leader peptide-binding protein [Paracoccus lichenicola]
MLLRRDRIHLQPDGVLTLTDAGPVLLRGRAVRDLVETLLSGGTDTVQGGSTAAFRDLAAFLGTAGLTGASDGTPDPVPARTGHVLLAGDAEWVPGLARELVSGGLSRLSVWSPPAEDGAASTITPGGEAPLSADMDLVIGALAPQRPGLQVQLEQSCRHAGIPFLGAEMIGARGFVGPVSRAGVAGCWLCARQRRCAHEPDPEARARADRLAGPHHHRPDPEAARFFARSLATEIRRCLDAGAAGPLEGRIRILDIRGQASSLHDIIPMPFCETCGNDPVAADPVAAGPCADPRQRFRSWLDPQTGVIVGPVLRDRPRALPGTFVAVAEATPFCGFRDDPAPAEPACGKGVTEDRAMLGAIGEAIERYAASRCDTRALIRARMRDLDGPVLDPRRIGLYGKDQYAAPGFPFRPFDPEAQAFWTAAINPRSGARTWVLAEQVYYRLPAGHSNHLQQMTSNGLAAGADRESAAMRAILEVIERDAILTAWLRRDAGRLLPPHGCDAATRTILSGLRRAGASVALHLLDGAGGVPVVMCMATGDGIRWPGLTATSAADPDIRRAAAKAVLEQASSGLGLARMLHEGKGPRPRLARDVRQGQFIDHACYYLPPRPQQLAFLQQAARHDPAAAPPSPMAGLEDLVDRLYRQGLTVLIADVTPRDVAAASLRVVRALVTGLLPLSCGFGMLHLGSARLRDVPPGALNPAPHPFC